MSYAVKFLGATDDAYKIGGYGVIFGGRDLDGETFEPDTDYMLDLVPRKPVLYDHMQQDVKTAIGTVDEMKADDEGLWIEAQISRSNAYAERVMALVHAGRLGWSTGSVAHMAQRDQGVIKSWPIIEVSLTPTPAEPRTLGVRELKSLIDALPELGGVTLPEAAQESRGDAQPETVTQQQNITNGEDEMSEEVVTNAAAEEPQADGNGAVLDAVKSLAAAVADMQKQVKAYEAKAVPDNDPGYSAPAVITDVSHWKYDHVPTEDLALALEGMKSMHNSRAERNGRVMPAPSGAMYKALAMRLETDEAAKDKEIAPAVKAWNQLRERGVKANEINQSTLSNYGDEWVGVAYSGRLWEKVRLETRVLGMIPQEEIPQGAESVVYPLEGSDLTFYKVAQAASYSANPGGIPTNTVPVEKVGTAQTTVAVQKIGTSAAYTGEMEEDSWIRFSGQLMNKFAVGAAEYLEHILIDGDTATSATTNINTIAGTPAGTEAYLTADGFRKNALVTLTSNSRDGGTLAIEDFLDTVAMLGANGIAGYDRTKVMFLLDLATHRKALTLTEVKTQDTFQGATIQGGMLMNIWGYPVYVSGQVARLGGGLTNTAGKVDLGTPANNAKGQIIAVRPDRWLFGFKRRMTMETQRVPRADVTEVTALLRFGLAKASADDASAISYNLTV